MTTWALALVGLVVLVVLFATLTTVAARRRAASREARRVEALGQLAERLESSIGELRAPGLRPLEPAPAPEGEPVPLVAGRLLGRAALLEAVAGEVARARAHASRLTLVLVRAAGGTTPAALVEAVGGVTDRPAYAVGPSAVAFTLPGHGRAGGLGALARIESLTPSSGRAIEWEPEETAVELVARLLEPESRD